MLLFLLDNVFYSPKFLLKIEAFVQFVKLTIFDIFSESNERQLTSLLKKLKKDQFQFVMVKDYIKSSTATEEIKFINLESITFH
jgi:hypothetical protein